MVTLIEIQETEGTNTLRQWVAESATTPWMPSAELVERINLPQEHVALVALNAMLTETKDILPEGTYIKFFQPLNRG